MCKLEKCRCWLGFNRRKDVPLLGFLYWRIYIFLCVCALEFPPKDWKQSCEHISCQIGYFSRLELFAYHKFSTLVTISRLQFFADLLLIFFHFLSDDFFPFRLYNSVRCCFFFFGSVSHHFGSLVVRTFCRCCCSVFLSHFFCFYIVCIFTWLFLSTLYVCLFWFLFLFLHRHSNVVNTRVEERMKWQTSQCKLRAHQVKGT